MKVCPDGKGQGCFSACVLLGCSLFAGQVASASGVEQECTTEISPNTKALALGSGVDALSDPQTCGYTRQILRLFHWIVCRDQQSLMHAQALGSRSDTSVMPALAYSTTREIQDAVCGVRAASGVSRGT